MAYDVVFQSVGLNVDYTIENESSQKLHGLITRLIQHYVPWCEQCPVNTCLSAPCYIISELPPFSGLMATTDHPIKGFARV